MAGRFESLRHKSRIVGKSRNCAIVGVISLLHSSTIKKAKQKRKLVQTPGFDN
jgi:hypothetical protein